MDQKVKIYNKLTKDYFKVILALIGSLVPLVIGVLAVLINSVERRFDFGSNFLSSLVQSEVDRDFLVDFSSGILGIFFTSILIYVIYKSLFFQEQVDNSYDIIKLKLQQSGSKTELSKLDTLDNHVEQLKKYYFEELNSIYEDRFRKQQRFWKKFLIATVAIILFAVSLGGYLYQKNQKERIEHQKVLANIQAVEKQMDSRISQSVKVINETSSVLISDSVKHFIVNTLLRNKNHLNVKDYFQIFPFDNIDVGKCNINARQLGLVDYNNGFIEFKACDKAGTFALFKDRQNSVDYIGVSLVDKEPRRAGQLIRFYRYSSMEWKDVTNELMPDNHALSKVVTPDLVTIHQKELKSDLNSLVTYELPRIGKTIEVVIVPEVSKVGDQPVWRLRFSNGKLIPE